MGHCAIIERTISVAYAVTISSTCFLFFLRIRAIFDRDAVVVGFFFFVWLGVVGGCVPGVISVAASNIGPTQYCFNPTAKNLSSGAGFATLIFDTMVLIAISWRLFLNAHVDYKRRILIRGLLTGESMPAFSRALLQNGQLYYLYARPFLSRRQALTCQ